MEDREFFDHIYQAWSKTTGAEDHYYVVEKALEYSELYNIYAVNQDGFKLRVAEYLKEDDADWFAAVHGCFADLYRRLHEALDDAESADLRADEQSSVAADALIEHAALERKHNELDAVARGLREQVSELKHEIRGLEEELEEKYL
ncbi:hypothetical protein FREDWARD_37 [Mycobacterium phage Fredward]|uniref:hypothetical protein n=1 Tax=Mycobacterium phage Fredward TaxID=1354510 RepID=UPI0003BA0AF6|nr:hypothetical protein V424_gp073 [Mycobacterium phage Fredward]AGY36982.1 hypothetical protein FREDWARD_37 [Mycobacterium phage Fredward]QXN73008.1 hypothetical protein SEA_PHILLIS_37 [Mycobacterium phage Phillis]